LSTPEQAPAANARPRWPASAVERLVLAGTAVALVVALLPVLIATGWNDGSRAAAQRERYGTTVVRRLAASAADSLLASDRIALSVLTREFARLDAVTTAAVYSADNRLMAAADDAAESPAELEVRTPSTVFVEQVTLQDSIVGYARVALDRGAFVPVGRAVPLLAALAASLAALGLASLIGMRLRWRLATWRRRLEAGLGHRASARDDLVALGELLDPPVTAPASPAPEQEEGAAEPVDPRRPLYVVVVNLFNQITLSNAERSAVLDECEALLDRVCRLYGGRHEPLPGTGLLIVLDALSESGDHAFQAICAALLAARVFEDLNHDRRREGQVQLALRIGVERILDETPAADPGEVALIDSFPETVARGVTLSALARDRSVVIGDAVHASCAETNRLDAAPLQSPVLRATGGGSAWMVADLAEGYRGLLDRQAQLLLSSG
jgi:uncharacterized membrane protein affecting hemolysin expression